MQDEAVDIVQPIVQVTTATESLRMCSRAQQLEDPMGRTRQLKIQFFTAQAGSLSHKFGKISALHTGFATLHI